jgi:hypothetical protein
MTTAKQYESIVDYCRRTGTAERTVRYWLAKGLPCIVDPTPGKRGRPRLLIDVAAAGNFRVLYARPQSFRQMLKAAQNGWSQ